MKFNKNSAVLTGTLLLGVAIGGTLGVLFAPDKGRKTRRKISNKRDDIKDQLKLKFHNLLEQLKRRLDDGSLKATEFLQIEKALNNKIMKMTMKIQNECPELSKYMDEMIDTIPANATPEVTLRNLKTYSDSLESMYKKYMKEHPVFN